MERSITEFLAWADAEAGMSANTIAAYRRDLVDFDAFLGSRQEVVARRDFLTAKDSRIDASSGAPTRHTLGTGEVGQMPSGAYGRGATVDESES